MPGFVAVKAFVLVHIVLAVVTPQDKPVVSPEISAVCEQLIHYNIQPLDFTSG